MRSLVLVGLFVFTTAASAQAVDRTMINRIVDEGLNHSELPQTAEYLTDVIGGRMTNSPQMRAAEKWTQEKFHGWGLPKGYTEGYDFGRGWSIERIEVRMLTPRVPTLHAIPVAWTPSTPGTLKAPIVVAPMRRERDFDKWRGKLKGAIVLISKPGEGSEPDQAPFHRLTDEEISKQDIYQQPTQAHEQLERSL